jgi:Ca2+-transporting ATPase
VTLVYGLTRHAWLEATLAGLALAISLMPEEFPVILSSFMALGAWRIARSRVLTRRAPAIESLGSATVLCVDKTGTLTQNRMVVRALLGDSLVVDPDAAVPLPEAVHAVLEYAILASQRDPSTRWIGP